MEITTTTIADDSTKRVDANPTSSPQSTTIIELQMPHNEHVDILASNRLANTLLEQWGHQSTGYDPKDVLYVLGNLSPEAFLDSNQAEREIYDAFFLEPLETVDCDPVITTDEGTQESPVKLVLEKILTETHCPHTLAISVLKRPHDDGLWTTVQEMVSKSLA